jgi:hypothetical protein
MDESTRILIAYTLLLFGFPMIAARALWCLPGAVASLLLVRIAGRLDVLMNEIVEGIFSFLVARYLFESLQLTMPWQVPLILIFGASLWSYSRQDHFGALPTVLGILIGIALCPGALVLPSLPLLAFK